VVAQAHRQTDADLDHFPCYVALFSLLIYFIGYKLRAGESEYNELHLVDVLRHGDRAELRGAPTFPFTRRTTPSSRSKANRSSPRCARVPPGHGDGGTRHGLAKRRQLQGRGFRAGVDQPALSERLVAGRGDAVRRERDGTGRRLERDGREPPRTTGEVSAVGDRGARVPLGEIAAGSRGLSR